MKIEEIRIECFLLAKLFQARAADNPIEPSDAAEAFAKFADGEEWRLKCLQVVVPKIKNASIEVCITRAQVIADWASPPPPTKEATPAQPERSKTVTRKKKRG